MVMNAKYALYVEFLEYIARQPLHAAAPQGLTQSPSLSLIVTAILVCDVSIVPNQLDVCTYLFEVFKENVLFSL
jgi:hypothetical protein